MSIQLKIAHVDGLRLRQQSAHLNEETGEKEWRFDPKPLDQEVDMRKVDIDGQKLKLGYYLPWVAQGAKNLVIEFATPKTVAVPGAVHVHASKKPVYVEFRNGSLRNQMRIRYQELVEDKKGRKEWKDAATPPQYVPHNSFSGVHVQDGLRAVLDEMPT